MLVLIRRQWTNIETTLGERLLSVGQPLTDNLITGECLHPVIARGNENIAALTLRALKHLHINQETKGFVQFEIINFLVSYLSFN